MKLFLKETLLAFKVNISNIDPPGHRNMKKSPVFVGSILTSVDGKQLKMLGMKMSGKMEGLFTAQDVAKDHELPGEVLTFEVTNLEKYFGKESWHVIIEKSMILLFSIGKFRNQSSV